MKLVKIVLLMLVVIAANAGKVTWDENGRPVVSTMSKTVKGCQQGGFDSFRQDRNSTSSCSG